MHHVYFAKRFHLRFLSFSNQLKACGGNANEYVNETVGWLTRQEQAELAWWRLLASLTLKCRDSCCQRTPRHLGCPPPLWFLLPQLYPLAAVAGQFPAAHWCWAGAGCDSEHYKSVSSAYPDSWTPGNHSERFKIAMLSHVLAHWKITKNIGRGCHMGCQVTLGF